MNTLPQLHIIPSISALALVIWFCTLNLSAQELVILDTDPGYDPDDVGCMAMLHSMANQGECHILAMVNSTDMKESPLCLSSINYFYNTKAIPVGDYKGYKVKRDAPEDTYHYHISKDYPRELKTWEESADAVALYREILASADDHSITIVITGTMHNFYGFLKSTPCQFSAVNQVIAPEITPDRIWVLLTYLLPFLHPVPSTCFAMSQNGISYRGC